MNSIKVYLDYQSFLDKPTDGNAALVGKRIVNKTKSLSPSDIKEFVWDVGLDGHVFCPATFRDSERNKENFEQQQIFSLSFNGGITHEEVIKRAKRYSLSPLFAYDSYSDKNTEQFTVAFLNDIPVTDVKAAEIIQNALATTFPESTEASRDITRLCYGGSSEILFFDERATEVNVDSVIRGMTAYLRDRYGKNRFKGKIAEFAEDNDVALTDRELLDVTVTEISEAQADVTMVKSISDNDHSDHGDKMPKSIIMLTSGIGKKSPNLSYRINLISSNPIGSTSATAKPSRRTPYRPSVLLNLNESCRLWNEFSVSQRKLRDNEFIGLASNVLQVESGSLKLRELLLSNPRYSGEERDFLSFNLSYLKQSGCEPWSCVRFCPYRDTCKHGRNPIVTAKPRQHTMEPLVNRDNTYLSVDEVHSNVVRCLNEAAEDIGAFVHAIKAPTAVGKSEAFLNLMAKSQDKFQVAVPTNRLKHEMYGRAFKKKIWVTETPSLYELKEQIPKKIWTRIDELYNSGRHRLVHPFINDVLKEKNVPCLRAYQRQRAAFANFDGNVITTHRKMSCLDQDTINKYDHVIIDEDFIFKSFIPNQGTATVSDYEALLEATTDRKLSRKIKEALKLSKTKSFFTLESVEWDEKDDADDMPTAIDISSFCKATKFCSLRTGKVKDAEEDSIAFIKPIELVNRSYIMVSATIDETICRYFFDYFFGPGKVKFYDCGKAKYKGTLNQYHSKTMSRACIRKDPGVLERIRKLTGIDDMITFLEWSIGPLHYGNAEGSNTYEGKSINVAGTPHFPEWMYKLFAYTIGLEFDAEAELINRIVEHNDHRFNFSTFDDEILRNIQFWMIESELEQAVGRARLLRYDCTANLFSNFPLCQAVMIDSDY